MIMLAIGLKKQSSGFFQETLLSKYNLKAYNLSSNTSHLQI